MPDHHIPNYSSNPNGEFWLAIGHLRDQEESGATYAEYSVSGNQGDRPDKIRKAKIHIHRPEGRSTFYTIDGGATRYKRGTDAVIKLFSRWHIRTG